jgi:2'-5' RNA ligase
VRLFVALDLPEGARNELDAWRTAAFAGRDDVRLPDPATLHVTLAFLGYRPETEVGRIGELMAEAVAGHDAPWLRATGVKPLPPRRPRLFALDLDDPDARAAALQGSVSDVLEAQRIYKPEKRPFWPHITLARVKRRAVAEPLDAPLPPTGSWPASAVTLYRSTLLPQGARYDALERVGLG